MHTVLESHILILSMFFCIFMFNKYFTITFLSGTHSTQELMSSKVPGILQLAPFTQLELQVGPGTNPTYSENSELFLLGLSWQQLENTTF